MQSLKVAVASLNQIPLDWDHNRINILNVIEKARELKASILCCPELCISGYGCEDTFLSSNVQEMALKVLEEIKSETRGMVVILGLPILHQNSLYNAACLLVDGNIIGFGCKQNLANTQIYYEARWFKAWSPEVRDEIRVNGINYPIGDLVFDIGGVRLGLEICEDAWVKERTGISLAKRNVDLILNPSASHFALGKLDIRKKHIIDGIKKFNVGYLYANLLGNEAGRIIYDGDTIIASGESIIAEGPRLSFQDYIVTAAVLDLEEIRLKRKQANSFPDKMLTEGIVEVSFQFNKISEKDKTPKESNNGNFKSFQKWGSSPYLKEEEFARAVALGLFDYLRKSGSRGFVLNLSGGADSATCACLIYLMIHFGLKELDHVKFQQKLSAVFSPIIQEDTVCLTIENYMQKLLACLYQKTKNNSDITEKAAISLANAIHAPLHLLSIDTLINEYCEMMQAAVGRQLTWEQDDITLQNIQARVRTPSAWILANVKNAILLSTSNRSEASVGYATMDGDTSGGLSPLAGIDKHFILQWLKWLEEEGPFEAGSIPALKMITQQKPTAELRPLSKSQTDEGDLMPYAWLDLIERLFVRDKASPKDILLVMHKQFPNEKLNTIGLSVERFFKRWTESQWKRERFAPSFHLDDESVDPKTACRFPILSAGFKRELKVMWEYIHDKTQ